MDAPFDPPSLGDQTLEALHRFRARNATIAIIGLGYVGVPLALTAAAAGHRVIGLDIDGARVDSLNRGDSFLKHIPASRIGEAIASGRFTATTDPATLAGADAILIAVPTPLTRHREPDLLPITAASETIARYLRPGQLVVLESTSFPGTTLEVVRPILARSGLTAGTDYFLAFSPEREDPGNPHFGTASIPKVVGGDGPTALALAEALYGGLVVKTVPVSSPAAAEAVKLTENIFRLVNIALVNELKLVYDAMGIDIWEVIEAARTKPFGFMPFYPGPGLGGHCIAVDPFYLTWKAREFDIPTRFIELAGEVTGRMPYHVVDRLAAVLDARTGRGLQGSTILIVGLAYKKNVDDLRESPALKLIDLIEKRGARTVYHDPLIPEILAADAGPHLAGRRSLPVDAVRAAGCQAALIVTDHDDVDYAAIAAAVPVVVDTRNVFQRVGVTGAHIVKA